MRKILSGFICLLVLIMIIEFYAILAVIFHSKTNLQQFSLNQESIPSVTQQGGGISNGEIPIYTKFVWTPVDINDSDSLYSTIKDSMLYYNLDKKVRSPGKEWVSVQQDIGDFEKEYDDQLTTAGWQNSVRINGHKLQAVVADGPTGNVTGYVKIANNQARAIIISQNSVSKTTGEVTADCPCNFKYNIFISDPISISKIER